MKKYKTRVRYESFLNDLGIPQDDLKSNGGQIADNAKYGNWIRTHDPIAFEVGFREWVRE